MEILGEYVRVLTQRTIWGPLLVSAGIFVLFSGAQDTRFEPGLAQYTVLGLGLFLTLAGVVFMFREHVLNERAVGVESPPSGSEDANYVVQQLSRNFQILRAQTNQGFLLSGAFMTIGFLLLIGSFFAPSFGLKTQGVDGLGKLAAIISQFIAGTALLLYRLNFTRLNETSDKLDDAWRLLTAYKLTRELPEDKKAEATMQLIASLAKSGELTK